MNMSDYQRLVDVLMEFGVEFDQNVKYVEDNDEVFIVVRTYTKEGNVVKHWFTKYGKFVSEHIRKEKL